MTYEDSTRAAYDGVAVRYAELYRDQLDARPLDRAMLAAFADLVRGAGPVADLGCGPGPVTAHLHALGLDAFGVDLSPEMIALARAHYPGLRFEAGSMTDLDLKDGTLGGIVSRYSIIHTPPEQLPQVFAEFHRLLAPGGLLLLSCQAGDGPEPQPFDHKVTLAWFWPPDTLAGLLAQAGLTEIARLRTEPVEGDRSRQAHLLFRRP